MISTRVRGGLLPILVLLGLFAPAVTHATEDGRAGPDKADEAAASTSRLTLEALYQQAMQRFPGLEAAKQATLAARATHNEQKWLRLPSGQLTGYLTGSPNVKCEDTLKLQQADANGVGLVDAMGQPLMTNFVGGQNNCLQTNVAPTLTGTNALSVLPLYGVLFRLDLSVTQPLYTFGKLKAATDLGQIGVELAQASEAGSRLDLGLNVVRAYFGLKAARAALVTIKEGQEQIVAWIKRIDQELEAGKGSYTEIDLLRMKVAVSQVELGLVDVERTIKSTLRAVRYLAQDEGADVDETSLEVAYPEDRDLSYYLDMALVHRPEMQQLKATGRGADAYRKLRIAELLPDFGIMLNFSYYVATGVQDSNNGFMNRLNALGAGLGLVMRQPLDFGPRIARLQKAQADVRQFEAKRRELLGGLAVEVERTYNDLTEARKRLKAAESAERRARGWLQGVKQNMDVGTAESRDMIDALRAYFDQHILVLRSINDVNVAAATLRRQCGLDILPN